MIDATDIAIGMTYIIRMTIAVTENKRCHQNHFLNMQLKTLETNLNCKFDNEYIVLCKAEDERKAELYEHKTSRKR